MASSTKFANYENFPSTSEEYHSHDQENDRYYETVEPIDSAEDASARVEKNDNMERGEKYRQPSGVEQVLELNDLSEHNARRTSISLETGITSSRYNQWLRRLVAATGVQCLLIIGCWIAIGMLFMHSVNDEWSDWSEWSSCSRTCGPGIQARSRSCYTPALSTVGFLCHGTSTEYGSCEKASCAAHVAFYATVSDDSSTNPVVFDRVELNAGNAYNGTTGIFTVPAAGLYLFSVTALSYRGALYLYKNNVIVHVVGRGESRIFSSGAVTCVTNLNLNQGDQVKVHRNVFNNHTDHASFSGALLSQR